MAEREVKLNLRPVPEQYARIYRARGMQVPALRSGVDAGALIPLPLRQVHKVWAQVNGFFWLPCTLCGREFGGHEITDSIPDPIKGEGWSTMICPFCTIERNQQREGDN